MKKKNLKKRKKRFINRTLAVFINKSKILRTEWSRKYF